VTPTPLPPNLADQPSPARYFPIRNGRYEVTPGLFPLAQDFGNGAADARLFQIDRDWPRYRANKLACRAERFEKYVCYDDFTPAVAAAACRLMLTRVASDYPNLFTTTRLPNGTEQFHSLLSGETLTIDAEIRLLPESSHAAYADLFDALCCQIPEDIAIVRRTAERGEWNSALHICAPSHWAAEEKIGRSFTATHAPVPGFEKVSAASAALTERIVTRGPFVRFTWSIIFADRLNCHPDEPRGVWDPESAQFRVERQTLWGLPDVDAYLFGIRVYNYPLQEIRRDGARRDALVSALHSMSPESRRYKGLETAFDDVLHFLAVR
jgi:dimethylamine monooxygenase subunit A